MAELRIPEKRLGDEKVGNSEDVIEKWGMYKAYVWQIHTG